MKTRQPGAPRTQGGKCGHELDPTLDGRNYGDSITQYTYVSARFISLGPRLCGFRIFPLIFPIFQSTLYPRRTTCSVYFANCHRNLFRCNLNIYSFSCVRLPKASSVLLVWSPLIQYCYTKQCAQPGRQNNLLHIVVAASWALAGSTVEIEKRR